MLDIVSHRGVASDVAGVIAIAENDWGRRILTPLLDYMQTTPAFVYLIPSVLFFGVGTVPGVFATAAFVLPPFARAVALGLDQVPREVLEAGKAVGLTPRELICKIKLPLAGPYLVTGLNQCIMMSLSMVVILTNHQTAVAIDGHADILKDRSNGRLGLMNGHFGRTYAWECG